MTIELIGFPPRFRADSDVRGRHTLRNTPQAALRDAERDRAQCAALGGGAYSDAVPTVVLTSSGDYSRGWIYGVGYVNEDGGRLHLTDTADEWDVDEILKLVGEDIAAGHNHVRRPKLKRDDWTGWVATEDGLYSLLVEWPDDENLEPRLEARHICDIVR